MGRKTLAWELTRQQEKISSLLLTSPISAVVIASSFSFRVSTVHYTTCISQQSSFANKLFFRALPNLQIVHNMSFYCWCLACKSLSSKSSLKFFKYLATNSIDKSAITKHKMPEGSILLGEGGGGANPYKAYAQCSSHGSGSGSKSCTSG
jgi:hypothetical protein